MTSKGEARLLAQAGDRRTSAAGASSRYHSRPGGSGRQLPLHGRIEGDTWVKTVRGSIHQLRTPPAWGVDVADLSAAERLGAAFVVLHDLEALCWYWAACRTLREKGWPLDRGFGQQIALALDFWRATRGEAAQAAAPPEPAGVQLPLFEVAR